MTTLPSVFQANLVSQMMIKTDQNKLEIFTCFNNAIQSILTPKLCPTPHLIRIEGEMKKIFLTTGQMRMIASKNTKIISKFLENVAL